MKLKMQRIKEAEESIGGILSVDDIPFCFTCEPRANRIPSGTYQIVLRKEGTMHVRYKKKFASHRGMIWLRSVSGREWIYIHIGNTYTDSVGCILVGYGADWERECRVSTSTKAYLVLNELICEALDGNEKVFIEVAAVQGTLSSAG